MTFYAASPTMDGMALDDIACAVIRLMRDRAEAAGPMPWHDVIGQRLAPNILFDALINDHIEWLLGYGVEMQLTGPMKHLTISHASRRAIPNPKLVREIMDEFGFGTNCMIDLFNYANRGLTLSVIEPYRLLKAEPHRDET